MEKIIFVASRRLSDTVFIALVSAFSDTIERKDRAIHQIIESSFTFCLAQSWVFDSYMPTQCAITLKYPKLPKLSQEKSL